MEEILIEKVRGKAFLYNPKSLDYRDQAKRNKAWEEIQNELKMKPDSAKDAWDKLRRCYINALNRRRSRMSADGSKKMCTWRFEKEMSFLLPYIDSKKTINNLHDEEAHNAADDQVIGVHDDISNDQVCVDPLKFENEADVNRANNDCGGTKKRKRDAKDDATNKKKFRHGKQNISIHDLDATDMFFLSLAKTTKTFPFLEQAKIKLQVSQAVLQAQIALGKQAQRQRSSTSPTCYTTKSSAASRSQNPSSNRVSVSYSSESD